jgi:hypothetical protein
MTSAATRRPTGWRSLVIAGAALVLVSSAVGATAATMITGANVKDGSLTGADVKDSSLTGADLKSGAVAGIDVKDGGIGRADLAPAVRGALLGGQIPSGTTITGYVYLDVAADVANDYAMSVQLPGRAPGGLGEVNFAADLDPATVDDDAACTGSWETPTAPPGRLCLYSGGHAGDTESLQAYGVTDSSFILNWLDTGNAYDVFVSAMWAYTAP